MAQLADSAVKTPLPGGWGPWYVASKSGWARPYSYPLPESYFPSSHVGFAGDFANDILDITVSDYTGISLLGWSGVGALTIGAATGIPQALTISQTRVRGFGAIGSPGDPRVFPPGPRYGYAIGRFYKHQAYMRNTIVGMGWTYGLTSVLWLTTPGWMTMEYCSNARMRQLYVMHGVIKGVRVASLLEDDDSGEPVVNRYAYIKLCDKDLPPPAGFSPSGKIALYSVDSKAEPEDSARVEIFDIDSVTQAWEVVIKLQSDGEAVSPPGEDATDDLGDSLGEAANGENGQVFAATGDFFRLQTAWVIEDPATLHEYGLELRNGFFETKVQKFVLDVNTIPDNQSAGDLIGVWNYVHDPDVGDVYQAHVYEGDKGLVGLPSDATEAAAIGEHHQFGEGGPEAAVASLKAQDGTSVVRVIMQSCGGRGLHNFCAGTMVGEFVRFVSESGVRSFEVVEHPRGDTLGLNRYAVEDGRTDILGLLSSFPVPTRIVQQQFWFDSEMYPGAPASIGVEGLFKGRIASIDEESGTIEWESTFQGNCPQSNLDLAEASEWGAETLVERHLVDVSAACGKPKGFDKHERWRVWNSSSGKKTFRIVGASVSFESGKAAVSVTLDDPSLIGQFAEGDTVVLMYDEPYGALAGYAQYDAYARFAPALTQGKGWTIVMSGSYYGGLFSFDDQIPKDAKFSITDNMMTVFPASTRGSWPLGNPFVYISTKKSESGVAYVIDPMSRQPFVFFDDPKHDFMAYRTSNDMEWEAERRQGLVRVGYNRSREGGYVPGDDEFVTELTFEVDGSLRSETSPDGKIKEGKSKIYWLRMPNSSYDESCPYFSGKMTGSSYAMTPLAKRFSYNLEPVVQDTFLPFEHYEPVASGVIRSSGYLPGADGTDGVGLADAGYDKSAIQGVVSGEGAVDMDPIYGIYTLKTTYVTNLVKAVGERDAFILPNGMMGLVYGVQVQNWSFQEDSADSGGNKPTQFLVAVSSQNSGLEWGRCGYEKPSDFFVSMTRDPSDPDNEKNQDEENWAYPIALQSDFDYAGAVAIDGNKELCAFGYVYDYSPDEEHWGDPKRLSLAMYKTPVVSLGVGTMTDVYSFDSGSAVKMMQYRASPGSFQKHGREFAFPPNPPKDDDRDKLLVDSFVKIIGGEDSEGTVIPWSDAVNVERRIVAPMYVAGRLRIFMPNDNALAFGIISIVSDDKGETWGVEVNSSTGLPLVYAREGTAPCLLSATSFGLEMSAAYLFYFADEKLVCKHLNFVGEGDYYQELLDKSPVYVVADGVLPHKAIAATNADGNLVVYYLDTDGHPKASISRDRGSVWSVMPNW